MANGIIADRSTATEFVWEVCDSVDAKNVCQHKPPAGAAPPHQVYTYGYDPTLKAVASDAKPLDAAGQKQNAYAALKSLLATPAPTPAAQLPPPLTGLV